MKNIKLSSRNRSGHHYGSIGNLHALFPSRRQTSHHSHRQRLTLTIGTNVSPLLDLVTLSCLFIGKHPHWQLPCRLVTVVPSADLFFTDPWVCVQKRRQQYEYRISFMNRKPYCLKAVHIVLSNGNFFFAKYFTGVFTFISTSSTKCYFSDP